MEGNVILSIAQLREPLDLKVHLYSLKQSLPGITLGANTTLKPYTQQIIHLKLMSLLPSSQFPELLLGNTSQESF